MEKIQTFLDLKDYYTLSECLNDAGHSSFRWATNTGGEKIFCRGILNVQAIHFQEFQPQGRKDGLLTYKSNQNTSKRTEKGLLRQTGVHIQREHTVSQNMIRRTLAALYSHM